MKRFHIAIGATLALSSAIALAQRAPESLLPPGFDSSPKPTHAPAAPAAPRPAPSASSSPRVSAGTPSAPPAASDTEPGKGPAISPALAAKLPPLEVLEKMTPDELAEVLGLKPQFDIPPSARRAAKRIGMLDESEGGMRGGSLANQNASLVKALLHGNSGHLVSRWGHILLRRALASRLDAPVTMDPSDFTAERAELLLRMGEGEAARALVQDVDTGNYTPGLTRAALDAYVFTADFTGACPVAMVQGTAIDKPEWQVSRSICAAFQGDGELGLTQLDQAMSAGTMPKIDILLAQKYAGAAGKARRAVTIEWDGITDMTPWRYAMTMAVGLKPPQNLMRDAGANYDYMTALAPMAGLADRATAADRAAAAGILSSSAMVDLYSQMYGDSDTAEDWSTRAEALHNAYVAADPSVRLTAMQQLWDGGANEAVRYSRLVLTAYAAARMPVDSAHSAAAPDLIASMLAARLDANALRWSSQADVGSQAWALLVLAAPDRSSPVDQPSLESYYSDDKSSGSRKSGFLLAGLAGLNRVTPQTATGLASKLGLDMNRQTRWTKTIERAADVNNQTMVALLAAAGMQGEDWSKMTPLYLYHIVSSLRQVGLEPEARMIAAEAVARG